jgi:AcrR family transcriptional regulator
MVEAAATGDGATASRRTGRPHDYDADQRILESALQIYGERGWYGLSLHAVATQARVGKALLYSRWTSIDDLLPAAFRKLVPQISDEGATIRETLVAEARRTAVMHLGPYRFAVHRLAIEGRVGPDVVRAIMREMHEDAVVEMRRRVHVAIAAGELPANTSVTRLLDVIEGAVYVHVAETPSHLLDQVASTIDTYIDELVDDQLAITQLRARG